MREKLPCPSISLSIPSPLLSILCQKRTLFLSVSPPSNSLPFLPYSLSLPNRPVRTHNNTLSFQFSLPFHRFRLIVFFFLSIRVCYILTFLIFANLIYFFLLSIEERIGYLIECAFPSRHFCFVPIFIFIYIKWFDWI